MSERSVLRAREEKSRRISLVWLIPFLALIVTLSLIYKNTIDKGPVIEVTISSAEGIEAGRTLVKMRSVTVGRVEGVRLAHNYTNAILTIQMEPDTGELLNEDSLFWLVKPRVESAGISGLDTLLSGTYLQIVKGKSDRMSSSFTALDNPPPLVDDFPGVVLNLYSESGKNLSPGFAVTYRGLNVGRVLTSDLDLPSSRIYYKVFIEEPYISLLKENTRFWLTSGFNFNLSAEGVNFSTDSVESIVRGGLAFDSLTNDDTTLPMDLKQEIPLFENEEAARADALHSSLLYVVLMDGDLKNISRGSGVFLNSVKIGQVIEAPWFESPEELFASKAQIPVLIAIEYGRGQKEFIKKIMSEHVKNGTLCAFLSSSGLLFGDNKINLVFTEEKNSCSLGTYRDLTAMKALSLGSFDERLQAISDNLSALDLTGISRDLRASLNAFTEAMQAFTSSNESIARLELLPKMTTAFENFRIMLQSYNRDSEFYRTMDTTLKEIQQILQDLKPAMVQIGQAPSSVLFGAQSEEVIPRAKENSNAY